MPVDYEAKGKARRDAERREISDLIESILNPKGAFHEGWGVRVDAHDMAVIPSDVLLRALRRANSIINGED